MSVVIKDIFQISAISRNVKNDKYRTKKVISIFMHTSLMFSSGYGCHRLH